MGDLNDQLRERAERAERERDYLRDMGRAYQKTEAALRTERDEARDALRALVAALFLDDLPRLAAIESARTLLAAWGTGAPSQRLPVRQAARQRQPLSGPDAQALDGAITLTERGRDEALRERDTLRAEVERLRERLRREWDGQGAAVRPIAVGERVRVVRCCADGEEPSGCCVRRAGVVGELVEERPDREPRCRFTVRTAEGWVMDVAAVERVEPAREEPAHAVGDVWEREDMRAAVEDVLSDGRLEFDAPIRELDRAYYCRTPEDMARLGWRRVRYAEEVARG